VCEGYLVYTKKNIVYALIAILVLVSIAVVATYHNCCVCCDAICGWCCDVD